MSRVSGSPSWGRHALLWLFVSAMLAASCGSESTATQDGSDASISVNFDADDSGSSASVTTFDIPSNNPIEDATPSRLLYVSASGENAIRVLRLGSDGSLSRLNAFDLELNGPPGAMVLAGQRRRLYVGVDNAVLTISLGTQGELEPVVYDPLIGVPTYLDLSADESTMVTAYFGDDSIAGHTLPVGIDSDGTIVDQTTYVQSGEEPHATQYNPAHDLVYVPHRAGDKISWYSQEGSKLTLVGEISVPDRTGPRHITFSSDGTKAYVVNETSVTVSAYQVDAEGGLALMQTISAIPESRASPKNSGADIHLTPDGSFLYASVRNDSSIAGFAVGADGKLTSVENKLTEARPREFSITPDGLYLVVAGQDSGAVASYRIQTDGTLGILDTEDVGQGPVWITIN